MYIIHVHHYFTKIPPPHTAYKQYQLPPTTTFTNHTKFQNSPQRPTVINHTKLHHTQQHTFIHTYLPTIYHTCMYVYRLLYIYTCTSTPLTRRKHLLSCVSFETHFLSSPPHTWRPTNFDPHHKPSLSHALYMRCTPPPLSVCVMCTHSQGKEHIWVGSTGASTVDSHHRLRNWCCHYTFLLHLHVHEHAHIHSL